jgi:hypothetical protein
MRKLSDAVLGNVHGRLQRGSISATGYIKERRATRALLKALLGRAPSDTEVDAAVRQDW